MKSKSSLFIFLLTFTGIACFTQASYGDTDTNDTKSFKSGFYVGANAGWAHDYSKRTEFVDYQTGGYDNFYLSENRRSQKNAPLVGFHGGYLHRLGDSNMAIALVSIFDFSQVKDSISVNHLGDPGVGSVFYWSSELKKSFDWQVPLKFGVVLANDWFLYAITGVHLANYKYCLKVPGVATPTLNEYRFGKSSVGVIYGLGLEKEYVPFRVGIELKNTIFKKKEKVFNTVQDGADWARVSVMSKPQAFTITARVSYLFY